MTATINALQTDHLGFIEWDEASELMLPAGLPGFERERRMVPIEIPAQRPLVFLQSVDRGDVCFVCLPVRTIDPAFELSLSEEDRLSLQFDPSASPRQGTDVLCLALLLPAGQSVSVNLDAPIVVNLHNSRCIQAVSPSTSSRRYTLEADRWEPVC